VRVIVVDDTSLYRQALADALAAELSIEAVETAADADAALALLGDSATGTVVLLNMSMPDGTAVLKAIHCAVPGTPVIALAVSDVEDEIIAYAEAGVAGCLLKGDSFADLLASIASVARGGTWCPPRVAAALLRRVATLSKEPRTEPVGSRLTAREREVMQLVDEGWSNKQIARRLSIELRTVKNHIHNILVKYQVHRRADAAALFRAVR
jgi:DNA-binding NarL/FixJ family response regulator